MLNHLVRKFPIRLTIPKTNSTDCASNNYATEATVPTKEYKLHQLSEGPGSSVQVTSADALKYYEQMLTIRRLETVAGMLYKEKVIRGFCHLYSGQEACAVGIHAAMRPDDSIITAYRCHGWTHLMGRSHIELLAELTGRSSGCSRGKGGSMHMYAKNFYGGNGIVGAQVPIGVGVALAAKYNDKKAVCFSLYGDGASNQGQIFEVFNMAKLWKVPAIFVCENNGYGMGTSAERSSASVEYYRRGDYVPGIWVDGMDVLTMREAARFAIEFCDAGEGPIVLEAATYRYGGHSMSDPGTSYRSRDEVQEVRKTRDPIASLKEKILSNELATEDEVKAIDARVKASVDEAHAKSKTDPEVGVHELCADIYADVINNEVVRNVLPNKELKHSTVGKAINV